MSEEPLLEIIGINKTFGRQTVPKNRSLAVQRGKTMVLIGPSGSGKSALLRCVNMLSPADSDDVFFASQHISRGDIPVHKLRQCIGMVLQNYELFSHLTVVENIMPAPMAVLGMNRIDARKLADSLLIKVYINECTDHSPDELSGGWQQRAVIARALAMKPELMLYDEPTSTLGPEMICEVLEVMAELSTEGMISMVVTHEMGFIRRAVNKILLTEDGEIIDHVNTSDFLAGHVSDRAQRFLTQILH